LLREHISGRHDHRRQLFSLLTFELWHRQFIGEPGAEPLWRSSKSFERVPS
jgi:hypothetical protein